MRKDGSLPIAFSSDEETDKILEMAKLSHQDAEKKWNKSEFIRNAIKSTSS
jgi:hypothetical protein